jgi:hypothetical protein
MATSRQMVDELLRILRWQTWPTGSQARVWGDAVFASTDAAISALPHLRGPFLLLSVGGSTPDPHEPTLSRVTFYLDAVAWNAQGLAGEASLLGAARTDGTSRGQGLLELEERIYSALAYLSAHNGIKPPLQIRGAAGVDDLGAAFRGAVRRYEIQAWVVEPETYPACRDLSGNVSVAGQCTLTWQDPAAASSLIMRRASGSTPPARPTAGTGVTVSLGTETVTDAVAAGTYSWALWARYSGGDSARIAWTGTVL